MPGLPQWRCNLPGEIEPWTRLEMLAKTRGAVEEELARNEEADYRIALDVPKALPDKITAS